MEKKGCRLEKQEENRGKQLPHFPGGDPPAVFGLCPKSPWMVTAAVKLTDTCSLEGKLTNLGSVLKSRDTTSLTKVHIVKVMVFPVVMLWM